MEQTERLLAIAGLLHDIGKIRYRAGGGSNSHSEQGADMLSKYLPAGTEYQDVLTCVACHHAANLKKVKNKDHWAYLVYEADNIAAGTDRRTEGVDSGFDMTAPLESVFVRLNQHSSRHVHYLRGMGASSAINYPVPAGVAATADKYKLLLRTLEDNFRQTDFATASVNEILKVMEAVSSYIPASTSKGEACDISLYDHSRLTAAYTVCMFHYFHEQESTDYQTWCAGKQNETFREAPAFLLVEGDLSGIQSFIYTIPSAGALKSLRGRSFYLEALLEHVADEILAGAGLSRANLLYTGGGHFRLITANTPDIQSLLNTCQQTINDWMLANFGASLYLQLAWQPASANDLMNKQTAANSGDNRNGRIFRALSAELGKGKLRRYDQDQLGRLFLPISDLNKATDTARECSVCHVSSRELFDTKERLICPQCHGLFRLGEELLNGSDIIAIMPDHTGSGVSIPSLTGEELSLQVLQSHQAEAKAKYIKRLYVKNKMETGTLLATHLWVGDYAARSADQSVLDFSELAKASNGISRLAVMRADIDNLGAAFIAGFEQSGSDRYKYVTLSRYAALSRQLSLFFKHHINGLCRGQLSGDDGREVKPYGLWREQTGPRQAAIVYSGGDDMFVVGAWDDIIGLAIDLRESFSRYSCGKLTLSAGIALFPAHYPVAQMAHITEMLEKEAKNQPNKDSIALFGMDKSSVSKDGKIGYRHVYCWEDFIHGVSGDKLAFLRRTLNFGDNNAMIGASGKLPAGKGLLYKLLQLTEPSGKKDDSFNIVPLVYLLARMEPPQKPGMEEQQRCYQEFRHTIYQWYRKDNDRRQLATALRLIIYGLRTQDEK